MRTSQAGSPEPNVTVHALLRYRFMEPEVSLDVKPLAEGYMFSVTA